MEKIKCFGYVRVSGKGQVDGDGFDRQEKAIVDFAKAHNLAVEKIYREEGISGTIEDRPSLAEMLVDLEENGHGVKTVIIEKLDRLARDLMVQESIIRDFQKHGFSLVSALEGKDLLSDDPTRQLIRQVLGAFSQYEKQMIVAKLKAARDRIKKRIGKCEGRKSYHEAAPEVISEIRRLRRKRKELRCMTYSRIADELNRQGTLTVTGKPFTGQNIQNILLKTKCLLPGPDFAQRMGDCGAH